ncbi:MAG: metallophosphoesterase, partial [bacterium]
MKLQIKILFIILILIFTKALFAYDPRFDVKYDSSANNLFYFIQISDTHIGDDEIENGEGKFSNFLKINVNRIDPKIIVNTGDLIDATKPGFSWGLVEPLKRLFDRLKTQQKDEWLDYDSITIGQDSAIYFDLPGNHDRHGDPEWKGLYDSTYDTFGYTINSVLGKNQNPTDITNPVGQFSKTITINGNSYLFIGANTCDSTGAEFNPWEFDFKSDYPELSAVERDYIKEKLEKFYPDPP